MKLKIPFIKTKFILTCLFVMINFMAFLCGCESNNIEFSVGNSQTVDLNQKISTEETYNFLQTKEKIDNNELVFKKNDSTHNYDNLYITFEGSNIKNVVFLVKMQRFSIQTLLSTLIMWIAFRCIKK